MWAFLCAAGIDEILLTQGKERSDFSCEFHGAMEQSEISLLINT
jgi:hypothetical protein